MNQNPLITWPWHHHDGFNHLEKYDFVNGKDDILYIVENKKCLKPPTSHYSPNNNQKFPHWPSHVPSFSILCVTCGHCGHISYDMSFSTLHVPYLIVHSTKIDKSIYNNCHSFWPTDISIKVAMFIHFSPWNYHDVPHTMTSHDFPWLPMTSHFPPPVWSNCPCGCACEARRNRAQWRWSGRRRHPWNLKENSFVEFVWI